MQHLHVHFLSQKFLKSSLILTIFYAWYPAICFSIGEKAMRWYWSVYQGHYIIFGFVLIITVKLSFWNTYSASIGAETCVSVLWSSIKYYKNKLVLFLANKLSKAFICTALMNCSDQYLLTMKFLIFGFPHLEIITGSRPKPSACQIGLGPFIHCGFSCAS